MSLYCPYCKSENVREAKESEIDWKKYYSGELHEYRCNDCSQVFWLGLEPNVIPDDYRNQT